VRPLRVLAQEIWRFSALLIHQGRHAIIHERLSTGGAAGF
jgi:hypothetical protein